ncbi:hypothetical protein [Peribacillus simplex]|uniref:hypothetical protein n=1 Tax=Peribacillus simplex TaxID=1478 RepID=UPI0015C36268|nr:hypothetical protein [Peribacillus simplex]
MAALFLMALKGQDSSTKLMDICGETSKGMIVQWGAQMSEDKNREGYLDVKP